jgi:hypothetical protein
MLYFFVIFRMTLLYTEKFDRFRNDGKIEKVEGCFFPLSGGTKMEELITAGELAKMLRVSPSGFWRLKKLASCRHASELAEETVTGLKMLLHFWPKGCTRGKR